ncbi:MAG: addiction module protein [Arcobacteraceae bacterium]|jgi:putative addiction module component (TIGR02574 family)|nr:addiction module protein [Arcobacteraceae bacterium]
MGVNEIIESSLELPIEQRVVLADLLTQSLNNIDSEIEKNWFIEVKRRLDLFDAGLVETITEEQFFNVN